MWSAFISASILDWEKEIIHYRASNDLFLLQASAPVGLQTSASGDRLFGSSYRCLFTQRQKIRGRRKTLKASCHEDIQKIIMILMRRYRTADVFTNIECWHDGGDGVEDGVGIQGLNPSCTFQSSLLKYVIRKHWFVLEEMRDHPFQCLYLLNKNFDNVLKQNRLSKVNTLKATNLLFEATVTSNKTK